MVRHFHFDAGHRTRPGGAPLQPRMKAQHDSAGRSAPLRASLPVSERRSLGQTALALLSAQGITWTTTFIGILLVPRLLGASEGLSEKAGAVLYVRDALILERCAAFLQEDGGLSRVGALKQEGRRLPLHALLAEARAVGSTVALAETIASAKQGPPCRR